MAVELQVGVDMFGSYHLPLAHDVLANRDEYRNLFNRVRAWYPDAFIILDNSVVELGGAVKIDDLLSAASVVMASCVAIPDVIGKGKATRELCDEFFHDLTHQARASIPDFMGVVQGENMEECLKTARLYVKYGVKYISVPRVVTKQQGSRMPLLQELIRQRLVFNGIHLMGFSDNVLDDVACCKLPCVMGIDSAVPIRAGLTHVSMEGALIGWESWSKALGPRGDFWNTPIDERWVLAMPQICENLTTFRRWIA
jgi:hypothetical protein